MRLVARRSPFPIASLIILATLLVSFIVFLTVKVSAKSQSVGLDGQKVVTIFDQTTKSTVVTEAKTVGEVLKLANITVSKDDLVEPSVDTVFDSREYNINIFRSKPVTIIDGPRRDNIMSPYSSAADIVKYSGIKVRPEDKLTISKADNVLLSGASEEVKIDRAMRINLSLYGQPQTIYTHVKTVGDLLEEKNIVLGADDSLSVAQNTALSDNFSFQIWRNGKQTISEDHEVDFPIREIKDSDKEAGFKEIKQPGQKGKKTVTFEVEMRNGQEIGRKEISSVEIQAPVEQIVVVGAKINNKSPYTGSLGDWLSALRTCESGGNYSTDTGNGYYGAYQFSESTWNSLNTGYPRADVAPAEVQDQAIIRNTLRSKGGLATQNPGCYRKMGLSAMPPGQ